MMKPETPSAGHGPTTPPKPQRTKWERFSLAGQLVLCLSIAAAVLVYLIWFGGGGSGADAAKRPTRPEEVVQVVGPDTIAVRAGTPLAQKLEVATVKAVKLGGQKRAGDDWTPVMWVTGMTLANLQPGNEEAKDKWQFATPDLLSAFADWQKAVTDVQFQQTQLALIRDMNDKRIAAQEKVVARFEKLVNAGTDTPKDLAVEETNLIQFRIQGRKEVHEAETALKLAQRAEATLARQLQQAGLEPTMLRSAAAEGDIVVAEVPERMMGQVKIGMTCEVNFFALPNREFSGKVSSISPVINKDKRVLNVQFTVMDSEKIVRPGMFAKIALGTNERVANFMPADGVLHVRDKDYALVETKPGTWRITEVLTGELRGREVEILTMPDRPPELQLKPGDRVAGHGAILLLPPVVRALQLQQPAPAADNKRLDKEQGGKLP